MPNPRHKGRNLKRIRKSLGITRKILAKELGVTKQKIYLLENQENIDAVELEVIAKVLKVQNAAIENLNEERHIKSVLNENTIIFVCFLLILSGLFTCCYFIDWVQKIMIVMSAIMYLFWIYVQLETFEELGPSVRKYILIYTLSLGVCICGFFYTIIAILFISYVIISLLQICYCNIMDKRFPKDNISLIHLVLAIAFTLFWYFQKNKGV